MIIFTEPAERAKAMGIFGFVLSGGATAGVLLGGVLTDLFAWNWIFLVNLPVGATVFALSSVAASRRSRRRRRSPPRRDRRRDRHRRGDARHLRGRERQRQRLDLGRDARPARRVRRAARVPSSRSRPGSSPLMPLGLFRLRNISVANGVGVLMAGSMFGWFFLSALYLQLVLGYSPLEVGLRLPARHADHGRRLDRAVRPARDALRRQAADRLRPQLLRRRPAPVRARACRRELPRRRAPGHDRDGDSGAASPSTRCCSPRWATSGRPRRGSPPES